MHFDGDHGLFFGPEETASINALLNAPWSHEVLKNIEETTIAKSDALLVS